MEKEREIHEQERVLAVKNKSVIVSASAGSGKTRTMINKIYKTLVEENVDISSLLVLTYTDAAATEMKSRLNDLLTQKLAAGKNVEFLQNQLSKISVADISTFHSFYEKLIKSNYYYLNINPAFSILEDAETEILKERAFSFAMQKLKADEEKFLQLFQSFSKKRNESGLKKRIYRLFNFLSAESDEEKWIDSRALKLVGNVELAKEIIDGYYKQKIEHSIRQFDALLKDSVQVGQTKIAEHSNDALSLLSGLLNCSLEEKQRKLFSNEVSFKLFKRSKDTDPFLADRLKKLKEDFKTFADKVKDENLSVDFENLEKTRLSYKLFLEFYRTFVFELNKLKLERSAYDFADLEKMALRLLENDNVREKVKAQYKYIFVDEFQDVNNLQDTILNLISDKDNTFIVGDPKQSIYAFRQSDVQLFVDKQKEFDFSEFAENLTLQNNYRSNEKILDFCNGVFSKIITEKTAGLNYAETSMFKSQEKIPTEDLKAVNILLCSAEEKEEKKQLEERYSVFNAERVKVGYSPEVKAIYNQIVNLIGKRIYDKDINGFREIKYGDIAVLVRSRGTITSGLSQIFEEAKIPYLLNAEKDLKKSKLVVAFISALRFARGYYSEIDLATILNKFFAVSYQELANIRLKYQDRSFKEGVELYSQLDDGIAKKINNFKRVMNEFRFQISVVGIYLAMNFLIKNSSFEEYRKSVEGFDEEGQMLNSFFKFVKESKFDGSLVSLLNLIDENEVLKAPQVSGGGLDRVVITTIHSSKGLEYPIVIFAGLNSDLQTNRPEEADIKIHKNLGIVLKNNDEEKTIFTHAIKIVEKKEALAENLRLLYVALTRAKNHLFISAQGDFSKIEVVDEDNINFVPAKYINYILGALDQRAVEAIKQGDGFSCEGYEIEFLNTAKLGNDNLIEGDILINEKEREEVLEGISRINLKKYAGENERYISQKTSVTELLDTGEAYESVSAAPQSFDLKEHLSGVKASADIGVAIHEIMERAGLDISFESLKPLCEDIFNKYTEQGVCLPEKFISEAQKVCHEAMGKIKKLISGDSKTYREKKFMLYASSREILNEGSSAKVLIQGIVDFFAVGEKVVLIDYKYSNIKSEEKLKNKYKNQLKIYAYAIEKFLNRKVDESYLINLKSGQVIKF